MTLRLLPPTMMSLMLANFFYFLANLMQLLVMLLSEPDVKLPNLHLSFAKPIIWEKMHNYFKPQMISFCLSPSVVQNPKYPHHLHMKQRKANCNN